MITILRSTVVVAFIGVMISGCTETNPIENPKIAVDREVARDIPNDLLDCKVAELGADIDPDMLTDRQVQTALLAFRRENILCYNDVQAIIEIQNS